MHRLSFFGHATSVGDRITRQDLLSSPKDSQTLHHRQRAVQHECGYSSTRQLRYHLDPGRPVSQRMNGLHKSTQWEMLVDDYKRAKTFTPASPLYPRLRNLQSPVFTKSMTTTIKLPTFSLRCSILLAILNHSAGTAHQFSRIYRSTPVLGTSSFSPPSYHSATTRLRQRPHDRTAQRSQHQQLPQRRPIQYIWAP